MKYVHILNRFLNHKGFTTLESKKIMDRIIGGEFTDAQVSALLIALRMKGETINELTGMAQSMLSYATTIKPKADNIVDTCGTGGDLASTFNISTISAIVAAASGATVAKHGNRSVSSHCGSADLLETLGVNINLTPEKVKECIDEVGIGFIFAPVFHKAMKNVASIRKEIATRTIFNILGPLTNPAGATHQIVGVYDEKYTNILAQVLRNLRINRAMVVHADDGLDEITISGPTKISEITDQGRITTYKITPADFGLQTGSKADLVTGDLPDNVTATEMILDGQDIGSRRDTVLLNAGAVIYLSGITDTFQDGVKKAKDSIESGIAKKKLQDLIDFTTSC